MYWHKGYRRLAPETARGRHAFPTEPARTARGGLALARRPLLQSGSGTAEAEVSAKVRCERHRAFPPHYVCNDFTFSCCCARIRA